MHKKGMARRFFVLIASIAVLLAALPLPAMAASPDVMEAAAIEGAEAPPIEGAEAPPIEGAEAVFAFGPAGGAATVTAALTEANKSNLTFNVTPADAEIIVTHASEGLQAPVSSAVYSLYQGEAYSYSVRKPGYVTQKSTVTIGAVDDVITVALIEGITSWDGTTVKAPALADGVYQIFDAEELAWFRDEVNSTIRYGTSSFDSSNSTLAAVLLDDIDLGDCEWIPIGQFKQYSHTSRAGYAGIFDGNGKTVSGLYISTLPNYATANSAHTTGGGGGLFGVIYPGGLIKDLTVKGEIQAVQYTGGIVGYSSGGTVSNCVSYVDIAGKQTSSYLFTGGIVGYMTGNAAVDNCVNYGNIAGRPTDSSIGGIVGSSGSGTVGFCGNEGAVSGNSNVGGIAGDSSLTIIGCYNTGSVTGAGDDVGGIAGYQNNAALTDSYNAGAVTGNSNVGGVAGRFRQYYVVEIENSYNTGIVTSAPGAVSGAIVGSLVNRQSGEAMLESCFYLAGTAAVGVGADGSPDDVVAEVTDAQMKQLEIVMKLGDYFAYSAGGYPPLRWQSGIEEIVVLFDVTPADAAVTVKDGAGQAVAPAQGAGTGTGTGSVYYLLPPGSYAYSITKAMYKPISQPLTASDTNILITVSMVTADQPSDPLDITLSCQTDTSGFALTRRTVTVSPGLAEGYGYADAFSGIESSVLDAVVAAHVAVFGNDPAVINSKLAVSGAGMITTFMGVAGGDMLFFINGEMPWNGASDQLIEEGDVVELFAVRDTVMWGDQYAYFKQGGAKIRDLAVTQDENFTLTLTTTETDWYTMVSTEVPVAGAKIVKVMAAADGVSASFVDLGVTTGADGSFVLSLPDVGELVLSAIEGPGETPVMAPWLPVDVAQAPSAAARVMISYQADDGGFEIMPAEFVVEPGLAESYGYTDAFGGLEPTALDAFVAAHIAMFGADPAVIRSKLSISGGWVGNFMGDGTGAFTYLINGSMPGESPDNVAIYDGDIIELFRMQNTSMWDDTYSWFEYGGSPAKELSILSGDTVGLALMGIEAIVWGYDDSEAISGADVVTVTPADGCAASFGAKLAVTGADGAFELTFNAEGVYIISAVKAAWDSDVALMSPWIIITVTDEAVVPPADKTALNAAIAEAKTLNSDDYTTASWSALQAALTTAEAVAANAEATQAQADAARNALRTAINNLVRKPAEEIPYKVALESSLGWLRSHTAAPGFGDEWTVLALARAGVDDADWYDAYLEALGDALDAALSEGGGGLSRWTDYERVALALTALGVDASDFNGYDLTGLYAGYIAPGDREAVNGTLNADIFALLALNSKPYGGGAAQYAQAVIGAEKAGGGWGVSSSASIDVTAMAIQALAPYYGADPAITGSIDRAVALIDAGTPGGVGDLAQIIVALSAIGVDAKDYVDELLAYFDDVSGGFRQGVSVNAMATEQAAYALAAYDRFVSGKPSLYDMSDAGNWDVVIPVNKTALADVIARAEALKAADYTSGSWSAMQSALTAAKAVFGDTGASQADTDAAAAVLSAAIAALARSGNGSGDGGDTKWTAYIIVTDPNAKAGQTKVYFAGKYFDIQQGDTVYDLLLKTGLRLNIAGSASAGYYLVSVNDFGEMSEGPESGWMFRVNGKFIVDSISNVKLKNGDRVEFLFTRDVGKDIGGGAATGGTPSGSGGARGSGAAPGETGDESGDVVLGDEGVALGGAGTPVKTMQYNPPADMDPADYDLLTVYYSDENGEAIEIKGAYYDADTGEMVFSTNVDAEFYISEWLCPFSDADMGWYYRAVRFVSREGLMVGTGGDLFSPEDVLTRAMVTTIIWRLEKSPRIGRGEPNAPFSDVPGDEWYTDAILWASDNDIVLGYGDGTFCPDKVISREEFAAILYRYVSWKGRDMHVGVDLSNYEDAGEISDWALPAMRWANAEGLITGRTPVLLAPLGDVTRAETAVILHRFLQ